METEKVPLSSDPLWWDINSSVSEISDTLELIIAMSLEYSSSCAAVFLNKYFAVLYSLSSSFSRAVVIICAEWSMIQFLVNYRMITKGFDNCLFAVLSEEFIKEFEFIVDRSISIRAMQHKGKHLGSHCQGLLRKKSILCSSISLMDSPTIKCVFALK